jgi:hypothetical protein
MHDAPSREATEPSSASRAAPAPSIEHTGSLARDGWRLLLPLSVLELAGLAAPHLRMSEVAAALVTFAAGTGVALGGVTLAARRTPSPREALGLLLVAGLGLAVVAWRLVPAPTAALVTAAAHLFVASTLGGGIGRRVEHPGHLLPACAVAAAADIASISTPGMPTRELLASERAIDLVAFPAPVPGTLAWAPVLGIGDLVFAALLLAACRAHRIAPARAPLALVVGAFVAGLASAALGRPVPALVPMATAVVLFTPEVRRPRARDRRATQVAIALSAAVMAAVLIKGW